MHRIFGQHCLDEGSVDIVFIVMSHACHCMGLKKKKVRSMSI